MATSPGIRPAGSHSSRSSGSGHRVFGLFELDVETGELRRAGRPVHLAPQPSRVLIALVEHAGRLVTREELKESVWGANTFVDFEQGLNFCIKQIRTALGDDADSPTFVETVPRRGYRLIAPVERLDKEPVAPETDPSRTAAPTEPARFRLRASAVAAVIAVLLVAGGFVAWSLARRQADRRPRTMIAVLPFDNLSGNADQEFFSEGFTEELIGQLGRLNPDRLGVIARTSTLAYRDTTKTATQIGTELGVQHLVEGTVRRSGKRVRINAQLIRVADQSHVWAEIYEGEVRDILSMQHEVGSAIARQIVATLDPSATIRTRAVDPAVYDLYLRGRFLWNRRRGEETEKAQASFAEAVRRDPSFAPAYAGLADSLLLSSRPAALTAADKALALDDGLAEAHSAKGHALMHMLEWGRAEQAFRRAIALDPSYVPARYFYSEYLLARGRCPEARAEALQGQTLDPLSAIAAHVVGVTLYYCRDYDGALPYLRRALALDPEHYWSHYRIALVLEQRRSYDEAFSEFARVVPASLASAYAYGMAGRTAEARRILRNGLATAQREPQSYNIAEAYVGLGQYDEALKWLAVALQHKLYQVVFMQADPRLDPLRPRPEFQALLREGGWE